jgi:hypothetical protein
VEEKRMNGSTGGPVRRERRGGSFLQKYGPWALVAGGSEGLGGAFAEELARRGLNLALVARRKGPLEDLAARLRSAHGVQVRTIAVDLSERAGFAAVKDAIAGLQVGLLVCNAALAYTGVFLRAELSEYQRMIEVNCASTLALVYSLGGAMTKRGRGGVIVMSSLAAFQGSPMVAAYGATKAFLVTLAEALADEWKPQGVDVMACCPAVVKTPAFLADGHNPNGPTPMAMEPGEVVRETVAALGRKRIVVPGAMSKLARFAMGRLMPRTAVVTIMGRSTRAMYAENTK